VKWAGAPLCSRPLEFAGKDAGTVPREGERVYCSFRITWEKELWVV
jgi:hypothetical protein